MLKVLAIILGVIMIAGGIYCLALPEITYFVLGYVLGVLMIMEGIERLVIWFKRDRGTDQSVWTMLSAIFSLIMGIVLVGSDILKLIVADFVLYMGIAWVICLGIIRIMHAFQIRKLHKAAVAAGGDTEIGGSWWVALILGILLLICGIIAFFTPSIAAITLGIMIGVMLIISGMNMIHFGTTTWMLS